MDDYKSAFVRVPEILPKNNNIFCAAENGSRCNGAMILVFFCCRKWTWKFASQQHCVIHQNSSLDRRHEILAQKDILFLVPRMGVQQWVWSHYLAAKKGETGKTVLLAGKTHCGLMWQKCYSHLWKAFGILFKMHKFRLCSQIGCYFGKSARGPIKVLFFFSFFLGFRRPNLITGLSGWPATD